MPELCYKHSFIDFVDLGLCPTQAPRSRSAPPSWHHEVIPEEQQREDHVNALKHLWESRSTRSTRATESSESARPRSPETAPASPVSPVGSQMGPDGPPSTGSIGHPDFCSRPCVYILKGDKCKNGEACRFCHIPHDSRLKLDKLQRILLQEMPKYHLLTLLSSSLRAKVAKAKDILKLPQMSEHFQKILALVDGEIEYLAETDKSWHRKSRGRDRQHIHRILCKMPVAGILGWANSCMRPHALGELQAELERLRLNFPPAVAAP